MSGGLAAQAMARIARFCSTRERAPSEVKEKLFKWGLSGDQVEEIMLRLTQENYLDEYRFAKAYCHDKFEFNKWGKIRIQYAIRKYGLPEDCTEAGLANISDERYQDVLFELASKKWKSLAKEEDHFVRKQKTINFLMRKGFEPALIYPLIDKFD